MISYNNIILLCRDDFAKWQEVLQIGDIPVPVLWLAHV